jgi:hypothetical protein
MKKTALGVLISAIFIAGCMIGLREGRHGEHLVIVPALPEIVDVDADQYYVQNGYYYRYQGNIWVYSQSREGPWSELPRSHYPKKVRVRVQENRDRDNHDQDNRDRDNHDRDNRDHDNR